LDVPLQREIALGLEHDSLLTRAKTAKRGLYYASFAEQFHAVRRSCFFAAALRLQALADAPGARLPASEDNGKPACG